MPVVGSDEFESLTGDGVAPEGQLRGEGNVDPFDVWWGSISEAMQLASPVIVSRLAFQAGQKYVYDSTEEDI